MSDLDRDVAGTMRDLLVLIDRDDLNGRVRVGNFAQQIENEAVPASWPACVAVVTGAAAVALAVLEALAG